MLDKDLEISLGLALSEATKRKHEFLGVEHILYGLLFNPAAKETLEACGAQIESLRHDLEDFFEQFFSTQAERPIPTRGFQRVIHQAALAGQSSGKEIITGAELLVAIYDQNESHASYFIRKANISRLDLLNYIAHGVRKNQLLVPKDDEANKGTKQDSSAQPGSEIPFLDNYTENLVVKAKQGRIDPLVGREKELDRAMHVLLRRRKNNPLFVGDAGVGKTALAEGLALRVVDGKVPEKLKDMQIFALDLGSLLAGTKFRGEFEERLKGVLKDLKSLPHAVLFIDEIHTIVGAGAVSGGSTDASNLLKPALASGELRCIGSTTFKEYRQQFISDHALARRFQKIDVNEPSEDETLKILLGLKGKYEEFHGVSYSRAVLKSAVELAVRYVTDRLLPDKAIDVIDEAGAFVALQTSGKKKVQLQDVADTVARMAQIPSVKVSTSDRKQLMDLANRLRARVYGQDEALEKLSQAIKLSRSGLADKNKPVGSFLFAGPTGVGKTEVCKALADVLGITLIRFDMSEYMEKHAASKLIGAPPGYIGYEEGGLLTEKVSKNPHCVLLLDEIEKAHPDIFNILLQVMDAGTLTDNTGRKADFTNVTLIMTSNAGAREVAAGYIGFDRKGQSFEPADQAIKEQFSPEFRNRLDAVVYFKSLSQDVMAKVVDKMLAEVSVRALAKGLVLKYSTALREYFAKEGYSPEFGARPLARLIQEQLTLKLADFLLEVDSKQKELNIDFAEGKVVLSPAKSAE
jgi:ATP-dependent Clp protease ATP-binding subunit ClpA